jgi:hypothetical protein
MADHLRRSEGIAASWHYIAKVRREAELLPARSGTFKVSRDPHFAAKVADIVGLYLDSPGGAVVLSIDKKANVQALGRTQPLLLIDFGVTEKRTHGFVRYGTSTCSPR